VAIEVSPQSSEEVRMLTATEVIVVQENTCQVCHSAAEGCDSTTCRGLDTD
jgi:hypothetical protein